MRQKGSKKRQNSQAHSCSRSPFMIVVFCTTFVVFHPKKGIAATHIWTETYFSKNASIPFLSHSNFNRIAFRKGDDRQLACQSLAYQSGSYGYFQGGQCKNDCGATENVRFAARYPHPYLLCCQIKRANGGCGWDLPPQHIANSGRCNWSVCYHPCLWHWDES